MGRAPTTASLSAGAANESYSYVYDAWGRRVIREEFTYGVLASRTLYLYDGWNVMGEFDQVQTLTKRYLWGIDLSGTLQGAGGVGGLVAVELVGEGTYLPAYDGHGNITSYVDSGDGSEVATFEYGPFGELLRSTGPQADDLTYRFSTKPAAGDLYYYGYRYYDPSTGRWLSRDPLGEAGGLNLYGFVGNSPISWIDPLGHRGARTVPGRPTPPNPSQPEPSGPVGFLGSLADLIDSFFGFGGQVDSARGEREFLAILKKFPSICEHKKLLSGQRAVDGCGCCIGFVRVTRAHERIAPSLLNPSGTPPHGPITGVDSYHIEYIDKPCTQLGYRGGIPQTLGNNQSFVTEFRLGPLTL